MAELAVVVTRAYHRYYAAVLSEDQLLLEGPVTDTRELALQLLLEIASCVVFETVTEVREASLKRRSEGKAVNLGPAGSTRLEGFAWNRHDQFEQTQWELHRE